MSLPHTIYVVDDQESILNSIKSVLTDEAYRVLTFTSAEALYDGLQEESPDLILLDIWLPGVDGIEALTGLTRDYPGLPIILMSGHAGVDIAVKGIKAGAVDFLEKPLNLSILLEKVAGHLAGLDSARPEIAGDSPPLLASSLARGEIASLVRSKEPQRTVGKNAVMNGVGLLSGRPTGIIITPAPVDSGIVFRTMDGAVIPGHITALENIERLGSGGAFMANSTVLTKGGRRIRTVEHLLGALHMMGVTNASIKVDEEIPNIDGSAADFCRIITEAGIEDQPERRLEIVIHKKMGIGRKTISEKHLFVEPSNAFEVIMRVDYPPPIHEQKYRFDPAKQSFMTQIAPARSFNTFENIETAQQQGMVGSGYLNSHIIIHNGEVINTKLNFPDEFVRHKILDLLGDLYLVGYPIRGRVVGNMTSHGINQAMALKLHEALTRSSGAKG